MRKVRRGDGVVPKLEAIQRQLKRRKWDRKQFTAELGASKRTTALLLDGQRAGSQTIAQVLRAFGKDGRPGRFETYFTLDQVGGAS